MPLDGVSISNLIYEVKEKLLGGRIDKVYQPEKDEIILQTRSLGENFKLLMSACPTNPRFNLTYENKPNPAQAPMFCMVLRKYIQGGKLISVNQPNFERIAEFGIESLNEMGDPSVKKLIIEIMGKHSNIILVDERGTVLDAIKHISKLTSSVREVLPGKEYMFPPSQDKLNPMEFNQNSFENKIKNQNFSLFEGIYKSYSGISPFIANEICIKAGFEPTAALETLNEKQVFLLGKTFEDFMIQVKTDKFSPQIIKSPEKNIYDFSAVEINFVDDAEKKNYTSMSNLLEDYYDEKDKSYRIAQKTTDIRKLIQRNLERCYSKKDLYLKTNKKIENRDNLRIKGELLTANIYSIKKGESSFTTSNFYDENNAEITIPINPDLTPAENAQVYFKRYNKEKRTYEALKEQMRTNDEEIEYLETLLNSAAICTDEADIEDIRDELRTYGYIKKAKKRDKQKKAVSKPLHFLSSDGFHIYVGKSNIQNDELTLKFANNNDFWFHTKNVPGSHVIVKVESTNVPDSTLNEAAKLSAYYSKARTSSNVPVDYTIRKNVKKPNGAKPGFVIYDNYNTAYVTPDENDVKKIASL